MNEEVWLPVVGYEGFYEVTAECLKFALDNDFRYGVFGGYSERERRQMKRRPA